MNPQDRICELINRLARLDAGGAWTGDLNPSQRAVLDYLSRANRFSRSPSQVAEYLGTTRGTISQTLKSLGKKGYVSETRSEADKRVVRFDLTAKGGTATLVPGNMASGIVELETREQTRLVDALSGLLSDLLRKNNGRPFGICQTCAHFSRRPKGLYCNLLMENLTKQDAGKICREQVQA